ncbi:ArsR/SmtB family transcription factor [Plantactinospora sp. KLBMP9567]|uniref:ArsR/SmtB family transcription factor n=1 Tax=Plantactinospora sp. KLBMP9567 TaxID=3085900 RepID=UPI0029829A62|nr:helix-turn-helix domain-containing protein [Plantactinospora sp. KLBMP9567]MDW5323365.1 helix-turn-helix domain-containing protein [Plantactinospora sp. KLBMP9567]
MLRIEFAPADLVRLRFAHSPMVEVVTSLFVLDRPARFWMYAGWRDSVLPALADAPLRTLRALAAAPTCQVPDFLTPVPAGARPTLDEELRVIADTPPEMVAAEVHRAWAGHPAPPEVVRFGTDPAGGLAELVREIRRYYALAIAPVWPRLRAAAEGEIAHRALTAAERGPQALLRGLHPKLDWDGTALLLGSAKERRWSLDGHPLALLPAGFAGPMVYPVTDTPTGRALWYPPRGYGRLWEVPVPRRAAAEAVAAAAGPDAPVEPPPPALAALLGPTRAAVLTLLAVPHSTGEVADALRLAPATASHHLTTLRDAGLVVGERVGRRLRYLRTGLGEQLGGGAGTPPTGRP